MQAQTSPRNSTSTITWIVAGLGAALLVLLLLSFMAETPPPGDARVAADEGPGLAYLEFGLTADTLRLASTSDPAQSQALFTIPHAAEYGIIPTLSPDKARFAYTALAPDVAAPGPDSPAGLWVADVSTAASPTQLASGVDLLVRPLWTPDGGAVLYRQTTAQGQSIALSDLTGDAARVLTQSATESLFPVGFDAAGQTLYFAGLSDATGSILYEVPLAGGQATQVATLSPGLTRDWVLSQDASRLAFLKVTFDANEMASRAFVLDLLDGSVAPVTGPDEVAFGPVWGSDQSLAVGTFDPASGDAHLLLQSAGGQTSIAGPATGFEVPLAYNAGGGYLVQAFENDSLTAPGASSLVLVREDGERETIAKGEVTLVGWTHP